MAGALKETSTDYKLCDLLLDGNNPRFGFQDQSANQTLILNRIVDTHGVDDVLSSLAVNGYFAAEPIVCQKEEGRKEATVREGNRRLAACLILTGDDRAKDQADRIIKYQKLWKEHGSPKIEPIPTILFEGHDQDQALFSYLGVRHIASSKPWDSFAKAAWVARVIEESGLPLTEVASMIGDRHQTISRMLEGYNFIQQLEHNGEFSPEQSVRKGRGSVIQYPFSWVYTMLGYTAVRNYIGLGDNNTNKSPIPAAGLKKAGLVVRVMFGDSNKGKNSAVSDSRQLIDLASAFSSQDQIDLLEQGKSLDQVINMTQPLDERLRNGLSDMREIQGDLIQALAEQELPSGDAIEFESSAARNRKMATELLKLIKEAAYGQEDED